MSDNTNDFKRKGLCIGTAVGLAAGTIFLGHTALGIGLGLTAGLAVGTLLDKIKGSSDEELQKQTIDIESYEIIDSDEE